MSSDPNIVGRTLALNKDPYTILGVLPEDFQPDPSTEVYLPTQFDPASVDQGNIMSSRGDSSPARHSNLPRPN